MDDADRIALAESIAQAERDGQRARDKGQSIEACPFDDDELAAAWTRGWQS